MTDTPSRLFGLLLVLVGVWVVTYWLYEPSGPRMTAEARADAPLVVYVPDGYELRYDVWGVLERGRIANPRER